jgi:uncharacterized tellurite resistance protein B-like protein
MQASMRSMGELDRQERMRLMKFVCSFAWADLEIRPEERVFVERMIRRLDLDPEEAKRVQRWLQVPPPPESIDPTAIPDAHRKLFLEAIEGVIAADGEIAPEERENLALFRALLP